MDDDVLLAEQRAYYRARAPEYDEWWQRNGRFDRGAESAEEWNRQTARIGTRLDAFGATGGVLEMAGGTGWWTQRLASTAQHLTVIDSSPETLDLNRSRVGRADADYIAADGTKPLDASVRRRRVRYCDANTAHLRGVGIDRYLRDAPGPGSSPE